MRTPLCRPTVNGSPRFAQMAPGRPEGPFPVRGSGSGGHVTFTRRVSVAFPGPLLSPRLLLSLGFDALWSVEVPWPGTLWNILQSGLVWLTGGTGLGDHDRRGTCHPRPFTPMVHPVSVADVDLGHQVREGRPGFSNVKFLFSPPPPPSVFSSDGPQGGRCQAPLPKRLLPERQGLTPALSSGCGLPLHGRPGLSLCCLDHLLSLGRPSGASLTQALSDSWVTSSGTPHPRGQHSGGAVGGSSRATRRQGRFCPEPRWVGTPQATAPPRPTPKLVVFPRRFVFRPHTQENVAVNPKQSGI